MASNSCDVSIPIDDIADLIKQQLTDKYLTGLTLTGNTLTAVMSDGVEYPVDLSTIIPSVTDKYLAGLTLTGNTLKAVMSDGAEYPVDLSSIVPTVTDKYLTGITITGNTLTATLSDGTEYSVTLPSGSSGTDTYVNSGRIDTLDAATLDYELVHKRNDNVEVKVSLKDMLTALAETIYQRIIDQLDVVDKHRINEQAQDYTLQAADFDGATIIYAMKVGDIQTITVPRPPTEDFERRVVIIRKGTPDPTDAVVVLAGDGVTFVPDDAVPLRRIGSEVILLYRGNGRYDLSGELP